MIQNIIERCHLHEECTPLVFYKIVHQFQQHSDDNSKTDQCKPDFKK